MGLIVGLAGCGLADAVAPDALMTGFRSKPGVRRLLLESLVLSLHDQPESVSLVVELLKDSVLDEPVIVTKKDGDVKHSWRAYLCRYLAQEVPKEHRSSFVPLLKELVESGKNGEPEAAKQVLDVWK